MVRALLAAFTSIFICLPVVAETYCAGYEGRYVLFDDSGEIVIESGHYAPIIYISGNMYIAEDESGIAVLDADGNAADEARYDNIVSRGGYILYCSNGLWGIADNSMHRIFDSVYTAVSYAGGDTFIALKTGYNDLSADRVYLLRADGSEEATDIKVLYGLNEFSCGLSPAVSADGLMGYISSSGEWAVDAVYSYASMFNASGYAVVTRGGGAGVIDTSGNAVLDCVYEKICLPEESVFAYVQDEDGVCVFDLTGENGSVLITEAAASVSVPNGSNTALITGTDCDGLYDTSGSLIYTLQDRNSLSAAYSDGIYIVYYEDGSTALGADGEIIYEASGNIRALGGGTFGVQDGNMFTVFDITGAEVGNVPCDAILAIGHGTFTVRENAQIVAYTSDLAISCLIR